jgi:hypothetical protein
MPQLNVSVRVHCLLARSLLYLRRYRCRLQGSALYTVYCSIVTQHRAVCMHACHSIVHTVSCSITTSLLLLILLLILHCVAEHVTLRACYDKQWESCWGAQPTL